MVTLHLYKLRPSGWLATPPEYSHKAPPDAELVFVSSAETEGEARDKIDRFMECPPYLEIQKCFSEAIKSGLAPSDAVRAVHKNIGVISAGEWPEHFREVLGTEIMPVSYLFIEWWPDHTSGMSDEEFNKRVLALSNA